MTKDNYVVVAGTFDLFHVGHVKLLERASRFGKVIALVNTDRFVQEFKKITPTIDQFDRFKVVAECRFVEGVFYNDSADLTIELNTLLKDLNITSVVFGDDYDIEKYRAQTKITREWQQKHDIALIQLPRTDGVSSSEIRQKLQEQKPPEQNQKTPS